MLSKLRKNTVGVPSKEKKEEEQPQVFHTTLKKVQKDEKDSGSSLDATVVFGAN